MKTKFNLLDDDSPIFMKTANFTHKLFFRLTFDKCLDKYLNKIWFICLKDLMLIKPKSHTGVFFANIIIFLK